MSADPANVEYWQKMWNGENSPWSLPEKHLWLARDSNLDLLLRGRQKQRVFFPLCGDAVDMKWLGDLGHSIIGVDLGGKAFEGFFKRHDIPYTVEPAEKCGGTLYKSNDGKYRLYCCDFFAFSCEVEEKFDAIFDSAALVAIHKDLRKKYADIMISLSTPDTVHLVEGVYFKEKPWEGPPYGIVEQELRDIYEPRCDIKKLENFMFAISGDCEDGADDENLDCTMFSVTVKA